MPASAADSTQLRTAIQNVVGSDPIINLTAATIYSVTTLAKRPSNSLQPALPFSGYTIQSSVGLTAPAHGSSSSVDLTRDFLNTRIYQQNIDGPYSPGLIKDVELTYTSGSDALLSARTGNFSLTNVKITGTHSGWAGNGNKYFSLTSFNAAAPITVPLALTNVTVDIIGQGNSFNGTTGGSAFLHSWNNNGPVSITNSIFDESGFASTLNLLGTGASPSGTYTITGNIFNRTTTPANRTVRPEGNRLQNVNATLTSNIFSDGSYLDLYGNISGITIGAAATMNTFNTITDPNTSVPGYGIRITAPNTPASSKTLLGSNAFTGPGLPLKYVNAAANTSYTLTGGTITVNGTTFTNLIAGGQGADTISGTTNADWINGDDGADSISGLAGNDSILGGEGNDTIEGGAGNDTLNGGNGIDTLSYAGSAAGVTVNLATNSASGGDASTDVISLFENLIGSASADTLTGDTSANSIDGGAGNDTIDGGAGNDTIVGGTGNDSMTGGLGLDVFVTGQAGDSTAATSQAGGNMVGQSNMGNAWALTFGSGVDVITGFETTDTIDVATAATAPTNLNNENNNFNLVANVTYVMYGSWTSNTFTQANNWSITNNDALVVVGDAGNLNPVNTTGYVLLENLGAALAATNFV